MLLLPAPSLPAQPPSPSPSKLIGWVSLRLKSKRLVEVCTARALLRGAAQQVMCGGGILH